MSNWQMEAFYNLKKKIVELSCPDETMKSLMESLDALESQFVTRKTAPSMEEIDMMLFSHRELPLNIAGPSKAMQEYALKEKLHSARRIDWVIAYGKLCRARCDLAEAEKEEKRLSDLYLKYID